MQTKKLIEKGRLDFLVSESLKRDGFGYLIPSLEDAQLEQYKRARPELKEGSYDLRPLARSVLGRRLLRVYGITSSTIKKSDDRITQILTDYENMLIEIETDTSRAFAPEGPTEQLTLNGEPIIEVDSGDKKPYETPSEEGVQTPLTEYMPTEKKKKTSSTKARRKRSKSRRSKKSGAKD